MKKEMCLVDTCIGTAKGIKRHTKQMPSMIGFEVKPTAKLTWIMGHWRESCDANGSTTFMECSCSTENRKRSNIPQILDVQFVEHQRY